MNIVVALTILSGKIEFRQNRALKENWDLSVKLPPIFDEKDSIHRMPKVYAIISQMRANNNIPKNYSLEYTVVSYVRQLIDMKWAANDGSYNFDESTEGEFESMIQSLKPKALVHFMDQSNIAESMSLDQIINSVKECFVKNAIDS